MNEHYLITNNDGIVCVEQGIGKPVEVVIMVSEEEWQCSFLRYCCCNQTFSENICLGEMVVLRSSEMRR